VETGTDKNQRVGRGFSVEKVESLSSTNGTWKIWGNNTGEPRDLVQLKKKLREG